MEKVRYSKISDTKLYVSRLYYGYWTNETYYFLTKEDLEDFIIELEQENLNNDNYFI